MKKNVVAFCVVCLTALIITLSVLPLRVDAFFKSNKCGENLVWSLDSDTGVLRISGSGAMLDYSEHKTVYDPIQAPWSRYIYSIRSIVVEEGVTYVSSYAFFKCIYASSVTLPKSVEKIGAHAFDKCVSLEKIDLSGVKSISEFAFSGCKKLTEYKVHEDAVCAENAFDGAGKRPLGCGGVLVSGGVPSIIILAAGLWLASAKKEK